MKKCKTCGTVILDYVTFCPKCQKELTKKDVEFMNQISVVHNKDTENDNKSNDDKVVETESIETKEENYQPTETPITDSNQPPVEQSSNDFVNNETVVPYYVEDNNTNNNLPNTNIFATNLQSSTGAAPVIFNDSTKNAIQSFSSDKKNTINLSLPTNINISPKYLVIGGAVVVLLLLGSYISKNVDFSKTTNKKDDNTVDVSNVENNNVTEENTNNVQNVDNEKSSQQVEEEVTKEIHLLILVSRINIRDYPDTERGNKHGYVYKDDKVTAYETVNNQGYTWYRIGEDRWIADDHGNWIKVVD